MRKKLTTILLVDGDRRDRQFMRAILEQTGYVVIEAMDYWDALDAHQRYQGTIDLLLTALALPGDTGYELARVLFRTNHAMKALFLSSRPGPEANLDSAASRPEAHVLIKPIRPRELLERVTHALHSPTYPMKKGSRPGDAGLQCAHAQNRSVRSDRE